MATIKISVVNYSTVLTVPQIKQACIDIQTQVRRHFLPAWGIDADIIYNRANIPGTWIVGIFDDSDQAGALGYHDVTAEGLPLAKIFAKTDLTAGLSWTVTLSHEILEMLADPEVNLTCFVQATNTTGMLYPVEVADAVEDDSYGYRLGSTLVSDFVLPSWFESFHAVGAKFDFKGLLQNPFQILPNGYMSEFSIPNTKGWTQIFGQNISKSRHLVSHRRSLRGIPKDSRIKSEAPATTV